MNKDTTRYIETEMGFYDDDIAWVCEKCKDARWFDYPLPEDLDFNFCPKCGRRIMEFVKLEVQP